MSEVHLLVNDRPVSMPIGSSVAAAIAIAGVTAYRHSVNAEPRAALCGMGICAECRVTINGRAHCLSCQTICEDGMRVSTT
jgi:D-hydroxyproline dehydrogenase subunit gamma